MAVDGRQSLEGNAVKSLKQLDPTWWRKTPRGYSQQDGRALLVRHKGGTKKTVGWGLYIDGLYQGGWWCSLAEAKRRAAGLTKETL